ncbi:MULTISPECIES: trypsin-like peptidase domain-containing protein [unclassified Fusibacter]|uniref:trypsin-like peptidase domain-containing protein n=1 Tax=unclassified Fusibacter TaxID=2624464 RepID=UPI001011AC4E|nr:MULTISPECIES: trypsin-like peptidase domain-containing protein [unclassified Fusibacter]MCK8060349.1 trypsin-like peptidase domain-containing protein [Fusibacter sp. A2]NPE20362.1 hypothetical protein [Fusibacter sp. A1]RXV63568.1 hypothetical protein DWB64_00920 [Fusibacter sp. A1]
MRKVIHVFLILLLASSVTFAAGSPSNWSKESLDSLSSYQVLRDSAFDNYQGDITRERFVYLSVKLYEEITGTQIVVNPEIKFTDTTDENSLKAATIGITTGVGDNRFDPSGSLTREQLAVFMVRTLELAGIELAEGTVLFEDHAQISSWARSAVYKAKNNGILSGVGDNRIAPGSPTSEEQSLVVFKRILDAHSPKTYGASLPVVEKKKLTTTEIASLSGSLVKLHVKTYTGENYLGSGFYYESGKIGTNLHVIDQAQTIEIEHEDGSIYKGNVYITGYDIDLDLAALQIEDTSVTPLTVKQELDLQKGQKIYTIGSPQGLINTLSEGIISSIREVIIQITAPVSPGSSGGALLDEYGELIGITTFLVEGQNLNFCVPVNLFTSMDKSKMLTIDEFTALTNPQTKAPTNVTIAALSNTSIEVTWDKGDADYYMAFLGVKGNEWAAINNEAGENYWVLEDELIDGLTVEGIHSDREVKVAILAVKDGVASQYSYSEVLKLEAFNLYQIQDGLKEEYGVITLGEEEIHIKRFHIEIFEYMRTKEVSIVANIADDSVENFMRLFDEYEFELVALGAQIATEIEIETGISTSLTMKYYRFSSEKPTGFGKNLLEYDYLMFDPNEEEWHLSYPFFEVTSIRDDGSFGYSKWK